MTSKNRIYSTIKFMTLALALMMTLVAGSSANESSASAGSTGSTEKTELQCRVQGSNIKQVLVTNRTDRVIAKGTPVRFESSTGIETTSEIPKNLKPGRTAIIYSGLFKGHNCTCQIKQQ